MPTISKRLPCFHVTASNGLIYGVSAHTAREAKEILQERLLGDGYPNDVPVKAEKVATWPFPFGTTICYGDA